MPRNTEKEPNQSIDSWEAEKYAKEATWEQF